MKLRLHLALALIAATATAQTTTTTPRKTTPRRATTATAKTAAAKTATTAPAANPADSPPNVPKVEGTPKPLYSLRYIDTEIGTGPLAESRKFYTVHYTGWLTDGTKFDSSHDHPGDRPFAFPYGGGTVIPGWDTGFEGMHVGGKRRLYVPYQLAYGESGHPPVIPAKSDLIFDVELVSQSDTPPGAPPAPPAEPTQPAEPQSSPATSSPAQSQTPSTPTTPPTH